jgi:hypothetical protein
MAAAFRKLSGYRVYCDESNTHGNNRHPVYGAILVALEDIEEVQTELKNWRVKAGMHGELKWEKVHGGDRLAKYKSLVDLVVDDLARRRQLLHFKAIIMDKRASEYRTFSKGNHEIGFYKFYYHWLLRYFAKFPIAKDCQMRVIIDERTLPKDSGDPYTKLYYALNNGIRKELNVDRDVVSKVHSLGSKEADILQAADVLMGAVGYHNQNNHLPQKGRPTPSKYKVELARYIALKFRVRDLTKVTHPLKENLQIVRWHWPSAGQRSGYRRRPADNPRPENRRRPGKPLGL